jgi:hypothetical protein
MTQRLRKLPLPIRILVVVAAAAVILALAAGVGAMAALVLGLGSGSSGGEPKMAGEAEHHPGGGKNSPGGGKNSPPHQLSETEYVSKVGDIQNASVEASLKSNGKLARYDVLTTDDIAQMKANYAALKEYASQAKGLDPSEKYRQQHEVFVRGIDELRDANGLAYQLIADPASATQADFEAYDGHVGRATADLKRSNELLGRDYKTTAAAQKVSLG